jgi:hypothetical protein
LTRDQEDRWREGDYLRFYMGTIWISRRADLTPVYAMIFRRLRVLGADWEYHFPQLYLTELDPREWASNSQQATRFRSRPPRSCKHTNAVPKRRGSGPTLTR